MAFIDLERGFIRFKIVYWGPQHSGKTANMEHLQLLTKGRMLLNKHSAVEDNEELYESMPLSLGKIRGIETAMKLFSTPGRKDLASTRSMILEEADGVVFVVDSCAEALESNIESLEELEAILKDKKVSLSEYPLVIQYNKRDIDDPVAIEKLEEKLNPRKRPVVVSSAVNGKNIKEALTIISQSAYQSAIRNYSLTPTTIPRPTTANTMPRAAVNSDADAYSYTFSYNGDDSSKEDAFARDTVEFKSEELLVEMADHLKRSIPPDASVNCPPSTEANVAPCSVSEELTDLYRVIHDFKEQIMDSLSGLKKSIDQIRDEYQSETVAVHEQLEDFSDRQQEIEKKTDKLINMVEQSVTNQVDGHRSDLSEHTVD